MVVGSQDHTPDQMFFRSIRLSQDNDMQCAPAVILAAAWK